MTELYYSLLDYLNGIFSHQRILGLFAFSEKSYYAIYLPSFEELCFETRQEKNYIYYEDTEIQIVDIRDLDSSAVHEIVTDDDGYFNYLINTQYKETAEKLIKIIIGGKKEFGLNYNIKYKAAIVDIMMLAIKDDDFHSFEEALTDSEKCAMYNIYSNIENPRHGDICIGNLINIYGYSRSTYNSLLAKMKQYKIAEISSGGPKGTCIRTNDIYVKDIKKFLKEMD